jgi:flavodoxin
MKIGIIVHSQTGNTLKVAEKIHDNLVAHGKDVELIRLMTLGDVEKMTNPVQLDHLPNVDHFDTLIFGGWIQAFNLHQGMTMFLQQLPPLNEKQITCFITQFFPFKWMGGNIGLSKMKKIVTSKGGKVITSGIVNWSRKKTLETQIETVANIISKPYM